MPKSTNCERNHRPREKKKTEQEQEQRSRAPFARLGRANHWAALRYFGLTAKKSFGQTAPFVAADMESRPIQFDLVSPLRHRLTTDRSCITGAATSSSVRLVILRYSFNIMRGNVLR